MEERRGAHRLKQRHLGDPPKETPVADGSGSRQGPLQPPSPSLLTDPPVASAPRGPSDTQLRERQKAWRLERERFEESKRRGRPSDPAAK